MTGNSVVGMIENPDPRFAAALHFVLKHEGGLVDDPDDPGGATNYGISLRFLRQLEGGAGDIDGDGDIDADDIRALTLAQAGELYREHFWTPNKYDELVLPVGTKIFDLAVNMGPKPAHVIVQRAMRAVLLGERLVEDGILGPRSRAKIAKCGDMRLLVAIRSEAAGFYRALVAARAKRGKYLNGWLNRAYD